MTVWVAALVDGAVLRDATISMTLVVSLLPKAQRWPTAGGPSRFRIKKGKSEERFIAPKSRDGEEYFAAQADAFAPREPRGKREANAEEEASACSAPFLRQGKQNDGVGGGEAKGNGDSEAKRQRNSGRRSRAEVQVFVT
jgi:hypothetical protein